ncbi:hypothetical protein QO206_03270 [Leeuwenhoekiella aequorea]|uniref:hypothetical protein n=1 Tax=Leeuwenhoekiella aequorea TaxID=283736 RepID=UPI00352E0AD9|tara:strand:+ start:9555 stop:10001 length:447 start_codon:yes stop_codon:yes gene_type:complete
MEQVTTYTVTGVNTPVIWQFKFDLNGLLKEFKIIEGSLNDKQIWWLFDKDRFPYIEQRIKGWTAISNLKVEIGEPDLSFEAFWASYNHKVKKTMSETAWNKLSKRDRIEALKAIKPYDGYLKRKGIAKAHASTYINQRYWEDNHGSIH